jgi:hypothetical protein
LIGGVGLGHGQQSADGIYSRLNTWSAFAEYSNDSSRILLGDAVNRKIGAVGFGYERLLLHGRSFGLSYAAEWRPGMLESDPAASYTGIEVSPQGTYVGGPSPFLALDKCVAGTAVDTQAGTPAPGYEFLTKTVCGRRQVIEQGLSPLGFRLNGRTRRRVQPTLSVRMGILMASQPAPSATDGNFNVFFDVGLGFEVYRSAGNSFRLEYVVQHYGNLGTVPSYPATAFYAAINGNPGVDSGFVKLTWAFGRVR